MGIAAKDIDLDPREVRRLLEWPVEKDLDERTQAHLERSRDWYHEHGRPYASRLVIGIDEFNDRQIRVGDNIELNCPPLATRLVDAAAGQLAVIGVSAGPEIDQRVSELWAEDAYDEAIVLNALAAATAERLMSMTVNALCHDYEPDTTAILPHYCPGYEGWELEDLPKLLALLADQTGPLAVNDGGMLLPQKSMLGVVGLSSDPAVLTHEGDLVPCHYCSFSPCRMRRAPYDRAPGHELPPPAHEPVTVEEPRAEERKYAFNERALKKWAKRYLRLQFSDAGSIHAKFTFDGSSCSNDPFDILYEVALEAENDAFRIAGMECRVPAGESAYDSMCEYRLIGRRFVDTIANHRPLEGSRLDDVLDWHPVVNPAGCLCETAHQDYKWRIVLQTILYELEQRG